MQSKQILVAATLALASGDAFAGDLTGNASVVSDYLFRGIDQSVSGAAVQGGVDYTFDMGAYAGFWATNSSIGGGNEADLYGGYGLKLGDFELDAGAIGYLYTEDTETGALGVNHNFDYAEIYVGGSWGPATAKLFYAPKFGKDLVGSRSAAFYVTTSLLVTLTDTVTLTPQIGYSAGDGVKDAFGDDYLDYSVTATKKLKDDFAVSLAVMGTTLGSSNTLTGDSDNPKFVVGIRKNFAI